MGISDADDRFSDVDEITRLDDREHVLRWSLTFCSNQWANWVQHDSEWRYEVRSRRNTIVRWPTFTLFTGVLTYRHAGRTRELITYSTAQPGCYAHFEWRQRHQQHRL